jgi:ATP-dependent Clp protease ATP-binding subunit ClpA
MTRSRLKKIKKLHSDDIYEELSKTTKLPVEVFKSEKIKTADSIDLIEKTIKDKVFGQTHAVDMVIERIAISRSGLKSPNRPVAQFLFLGPTGVGKTELAKTLAESMGVYFAKFDMSEYQEKHSVAKLIGAPPGYVGYEDANLGGGLLISAVEKNPHCVLLLDEIEKADPQVSNVLLQIMDSGWITSSNGKRVDCRSCIVILTSNLGAAQAERPGLGFVHQSRDDEEKATKEFFAPEFRNRLDAVIKFNKLDRENIRTIAGKFVREINELIADKNCEITLTDAAYDLLLEKGYDAKMGARPMGRAIDQLIKVPLSRKLLATSVGKKKKIIKFDRLDNTLSMT